MGGQFPGTLCGERHGPVWIDHGTMCLSQSSPPGPIMWRPSAEDVKRMRRARALNGAWAFTILQASLPFVSEHMTPEQIQKMQKVLDADVVNPGVEKEYQAL